MNWIDSMNQGFRYLFLQASGSIPVRRCIISAYAWAGIYLSIYPFALHCEVPVLCREEEYRGGRKRMAYRGSLASCRSGFKEGDGIPRCCGLCVCVDA